MALFAVAARVRARAVASTGRGDRSVAERGYLTLNPLKQTHPILSIVLPVAFLLLGGIRLPGGADGWTRTRYAASSPTASSARPARGKRCVRPWLDGAVPHRCGHVRASGLLVLDAFLGFLQLTAALLDLVPIPGVDGGNILRPWLSPVWARRFRALFAPYGMLLLIALLLECTVNNIFFTVVFTICDIIGLPTGLAMHGRDMFQFWY